VLLHRSTIVASHVSVFEQSLCCNLIIPASHRRHIPSHGISEPVINIEQERDFHGVLDCVLRNARTHHCPHVLRSEAAMVECHLLEKGQRCAKLFANRRARELIQDLLYQQIAVEG